MSKSSTGKKEEAGKNRVHKAFWFDAIKAVRDMSKKHSGLTSSQKAVLTAIALRMNNVDKSCYPSQETLAEDTCLTSKTVRAATQRLEDSGLIECEKEKEGNGGSYYRYHFNLANISALHRKNFKLVPGRKKGRAKATSKNPSEEASTITKMGKKKPSNNLTKQDSLTKQSVNDGTSKGELTDFPIGSDYPQSKEKGSKEELSNESLENLDNESYQLPASSSPGDLPCGKDFSPAGFTDSFAATSNSQECNQVHLLKEVGAPVRPDCISAASWKLLEGFRPELMDNREARVRFVCDLIRHHFPQTRKYKKLKPLCSADSNSLHKYFDTYEILTPELLCIGVQQFAGDPDGTPSLGNIWQNRDSALFAWAESVTDDREFLYQGEKMAGRELVESVWENRDLNVLSLGPS